MKSSKNNCLYICTIICDFLMEVEAYLQFHFQESSWIAISLFMCSLIITDIVRTIGIKGLEVLNGIGKEYNHLLFCAISLLASFLCLIGCLWYKVQAPGLLKNWGNKAWGEIWPQINRISHFLDENVQLKMYP